MFVTRPLSLYKANPGGTVAAEATAAPPHGPHSGYLILQDEEFEAQSTSCFGLCHNPYFAELPLSQNRRLTVLYSLGYSTAVDDVLLVPVPDQPVSANRYYVVCASGSHAGEIWTCSRKQDRTSCCCCSLVKDVKPGPFREGDVYQQVEVVPQSVKGYFSARAVADDGYPPYFLRQQSWTIRASGTRKLNVDIGTAAGVDPALREKNPPVSFSIAGGMSPAVVVVVGRWYTPFFFVKEESSPKEQMKRSAYYEVALEQFCEAIVTRRNSSNDEGSRVKVRTTVQTESAILSGGEPVGQVLPQPDGSVLFRPVASPSEAVSLSSCLIERMKWEQDRGGWIPGEGGVVEVEREEEYTGSGSWSSFGCFVLVERFSLRRLDGSLVLARDFRHAHKILVQWE